MAFDDSSLLVCNHLLFRLVFLSSSLTHFMHFISHSTCPLSHCIPLLFRIINKVSMALCMCISSMAMHFIALDWITHISSNSFQTGTSQTASVFNFKFSAYVTVLIFWMKFYNEKKKPTAKKPITARYSCWLHCILHLYIQDIYNGFCCINNAGEKKWRRKKQQFTRLMIPLMWNSIHYKEERKTSNGLIMLLSGGALKKMCVASDKWKKSTSWLSKPACTWVALISDYHNQVCV